MKKNIEIGGELLTFRCSAATRKLFSRAFKQNIDEEIAKYAEFLPELRKALEEINKEEPETPEQQFERVQKINNSPEVQKANAFTVDFWPKFAYITYLEGNKDFHEINALATEDHFLEWLLQYDESDFVSKAGEFMQLWVANKNTTVTRKNP